MIKVMKMKPIQSTHVIAFSGVMTPGHPPQHTHNPHPFAATPPQACLQHACISPRLHACTHANAHASTPAHTPARMQAHTHARVHPGIHQNEMRFDLSDSVSAAAPVRIRLDG